MITNACNNMSDAKYKLSGHFWPKSGPNLGSGHMGQNLGKPRIFPSGVSRSPWAPIYLADRSILSITYAIESYSST